MIASSYRWRRSRSTGSSFASIRAKADTATRRKRILVLEKIILGQIHPLGAQPQIGADQDRGEDLEVQARLSGEYDDGMVGQAIHVAVDAGLGGDGGTGVILVVKPF